MRGVTAVVLLVVWAGAARVVSGTRYAFYRSMVDKSERGGEGEYTRRVFGGEAAELATFPAACALMDRYWRARCSAAVVAPRWALTAAHCVTPRIAYIKYNMRRPIGSDGKYVAVHYLYRHPDFKVVNEDEGRGMDVTLLHHDVGLVRTREDMVLESRPATDPLVALRLYNPVDLKNEEVEVLGFGRTERSSMGEELFSVKLQLVFCDRGSWFHCVCGVATGRDRRGVCSGDSGGPVLYRGVQVGVTSMGPVECSQENSSDAGVEPGTGATSVFTALYNYADLVNDTIYDTEEALRMQRIVGSAEKAATASTAHLATLTLVPLLLTILPAR